MKFSYYLDPESWLRSSSQDTLEALEHIWKDVSNFQNSLQITGSIRRKFQEIILIVWSGMTHDFQGMSGPSATRAKLALDLAQNKKDTLIVPMARYTYRLMNQYPSSTDARNIGKYLVSKWVSPEQILLEEWSMCTFGNAVFTEVLLGTVCFEDIPVKIITSEWAKERTELLFPLVMRGRILEILTVSGDLTSEQEDQRQKQDAIVNKYLYEPIISVHNLRWPDVLVRSASYLRNESTSTGNPPDLFSYSATQRVRSAWINANSSYSVPMS